MLQARSLWLRARKKTGVTATVPAGTVFSCATAGTRDRVMLLRGDLLFRPVELGSIDPHAVQNDGQLARDSDLGFAQAVSLGKSHPPSLQGRPFRHAR